MQQNRNFDSKWEQHAFPFNAEFMDPWIHGYQGNHEQVCMEDVLLKGCIQTGESHLLRFESA